MLDSAFIKAQIELALPDANIDISDVQGHHFYIVVSSASFSGQTLLQRQRRVYAALQPWLASGELHAIELKVVAPNEA